MKLVDTAQMREIDRLTIEKYKIPGIILMENAGKAIADYVEKIDGRVLVVCGKGNNGGDGSVAARHLFSRGRAVKLTYICGTEGLSGDAKTAYEMARDIGTEIVLWSDSLLKECDIVVDAILGIGARGAPTDDIARVIDAINASGKTVVSADVPSGGNADNGWVEGSCIKANCTITFGLCKTGLVCYPLRSYAGKVLVKNASFAPGAVERQDIKTQTIEKEPLPEISPMRHKGSAGRVFVLAGSKGMTGAAYLNCAAAMKAGCGFTALGIPESLNGIMGQKLTEVISLSFKDNYGVLSSDATVDIINSSKGYDVMVCGSGLSQNKDICDIITHIVKHSEIPLVLDADGLNVISQYADVLKEKSCDIIITPHIGEMGRLINKPSKYVEENTVKVAKAFSEEYNVTVVLKSAHTVIACPTGEAYINTAGNAGMATAGSGDVLAGIIGSFIAQGFGVVKSAVHGVRVHAEAGDAAAAKIGMRSVMATDILNNILQERGLK